MTSYQWQAGVGALADRQMNPHYDPSAFDQKVTFGTVEFLRLCRELGAEPLLTTNVVTASAADAAGWVHYVNHAGLQDPAGNPLAHVTWWEIWKRAVLPWGADRICPGARGIRLARERDDSGDASRGSGHQGRSAASKRQNRKRVDDRLRRVQ